MLALLFAVTLVAACSRDINLLPPRADGSVAGDTSVTNPICSGLGAPIQLPTATGAACAAALATRGHRFALCSCESVSAPARIRTDSFDSRLTPVFEETRRGDRHRRRPGGERRGSRGRRAPRRGTGRHPHVDAAPLGGIAARRRAGDAVRPERRRRHGRVRQRKRLWPPARQWNVARAARRAAHRRRRIHHARE